MMIMMMMIKVSQCPKLDRPTMQT